MMIEDYTFGSIKIQGQVYREDVLISDRTVLSPWYRRSGHTVEVEDLDEVLRSGPRVLVLGKGKPGMMTASRELKRYLQKQGIELIEQPSETAMRTFNRLLAEGESVCGGFHLTC